MLPRPEVKLEGRDDKEVSRIESPKAVTKCNASNGERDLVAYPFSPKVSLVAGRRPPPPPNGRHQFHPWSPVNCKVGFVTEIGRPRAKTTVSPKAPGEATCGAAANSTFLRYRVSAVSHILPTRAIK